MKILSLIQYDLIKTMREKIALFFMFLMPVMFIAIFGSLNFTEDARIPVAISSHDDGKIAVSVISELKKDKNIRVEEVSEDQLFEEVKNVNVEAGFIIPKDFTQKVMNGGKPQISIVKLPSSSGFLPLQNKISDIYMGMAVKEGTVSYFKEKVGNLDEQVKNIIITDISSRLEENLKNSDILKVSSILVNEDKNKSSDKGRLSLGFVMMFVMFTIVFSVGDILEEKKNNTWDRLSITPTKTSTVILGKILATFVKGWIQVFTLIVFAKLVMGITWGNSIPVTALVMSCFMLCVTGIGMFLASIVKSHAQMGAVISIVITCSSMLSGCYWPLDIVPDFMQQIAKLFPQYWAMKGVVAGSSDTGTVLTSVLILFVMGLGFFLLSVMSGKLGNKFSIPSKKVKALDKAA